MKEQYKIDLDKIHIIEKHWLQEIITFVALITIVIGLIFYQLTTFEHLGFFTFLLFFIICIQCWAIYSVRKDMRRIWQSLRIVLSENDIQFNSQRPIYGEFGGQSWKKNSKKVTWKYARLKSHKRSGASYIIDESKFIGTLFGIGRYKIPLEIEDRDHLLEIIKSKITAI